MMILLVGPVGPEQPDLPIAKKGKSEATPKANNQNPVGDTSAVVSGSSIFGSNTTNPLAQAVLKFFGNRIKSGKTTNPVANLAIAKLEAGGINFTSQGGNSASLGDA